MSQHKDIVNHMMSHDRFSQWLGIEIKEVRLGSCILEMTVREEMCNGFGVCHGGIQFSLADSALAFSCNAHGMKTMSIEASISHFAPVHIGDVLTARSSE
ncbi:MAG: hotdog fold thioesterase, partial [Flavobacteriales bacterium]|nr:hotdog fold thioesterase [Flavobacteriales bacterium]